MTITITNKLGQLRLGLGGFRLISAEGFTAAEYSPYIIDYGLIDGGRFHSSRVPPRKLKVVFTVWGADSERQREHLIGFLNPKISHLIRVEHNGIIREIDGYVRTFSTHRDSIERPITATLEFICPDPFFRNTVPTVSSYEYFSPQIAFPLVFTNDGIIAGYSIASNELSVTNPGHDSTGFVAQLTCIQGTVSNILLKSLTNGEYILFSGTLKEGDTLVISTVSGDKSVTVNGANSISLIDRKSSFFHLDIGKNTISCTSNSDRKCLDVRLRFTPRFLGV